MASPARTADPLQVLRRPDDRIVGHGVVSRVVQVMGPVVDAVPPRLDRLLPADQRGTFGDEHAHDLGHRNVAEILGHDQVDQVVHVGQAFAVKGINGNFAVQT